MFWIQSNCQNRQSWCCRGGCVCHIFSVNFSAKAESCVSTDQIQRLTGSTNCTCNITFLSGILYIYYYLWRFCYEYWAGFYWVSGAWSCRTMYKFDWWFIKCIMTWHVWKINAVLIFTLWELKQMKLYCIVFLNPILQFNLSSININFKQC